jgi:hypothetical protein
MPGKRTWSDKILQRNPTRRELERENTRLTDKEMRSRGERDRCWSKLRDCNHKVEVLEEAILEERLAHRETKNELIQTTADLIKCRQDCGEPDPIEVPGAGHKVEVNPGAREMRLTSASYPDFRDILEAEGDRKFIVDPSLAGEVIEYSKPIILGRAQSGLQMPRPPAGFAIRQDGYGGSDLISFGHKGTSEEGIVTNLYMFGMTGLGGASIHRDSSGYADNWAFRAVTNSYFEDFISIGNIDKGQIGRLCHGLTFMGGWDGAGLAAPDPPHYKNQQHNRTLSTYNHGEVTFINRLFGPDDWRQSGNLKGAGPTEYYGCIFLMTGRHESSIGRNSRMGPNNTVIWEERPAFANFKRGCVWIIGPDATNRYLFNGEGQKKNPSLGAAGAAHIYVDESCQVQRLSMALKARFSPACVENSYEIDAPNPVSYPEVPNYASMAGKSQFDYTLDRLDDLGKVNGYPHAMAIVKRIRSGELIEPQKHIDELL